MGCKISAKNELVRVQHVLAGVLQQFQIQAMPILDILVQLV